MGRVSLRSSGEPGWGRAAYTLLHIVVVILIAPCSLFEGELYFMSTGMPSATAARGVIYKVIDPSR